MGKGSTPRKCLISDEEYRLRWELAFGYITPQEFKKKLKKLQKRKDKL